MDMYFNSASFDFIRESISKNQKKCKLAFVDSFTLFMLLQLHIKGKRFAEQRVSLDVLRPIFSPTNDRRKDKDIIYFLNILQDANMITFALNKREVVYRFVKHDLGEGERFVFIKHCNRHIMEDHHSNAPFALYCLLRRLHRSKNHKFLPVRISFKEMRERLCISFDTLDSSKRVLEKDGYIFTIKKELALTPDGLKRGCNEYRIFNYDNRKPEKYEIHQMELQQMKVQVDMSRQAEREPMRTEFDAIDWDF